MTKMQIFFSIILITTFDFSALALDSSNIIGVYTSPFPYPYRFEIINSHEMKLEWADTGKEYRSWEKSKTYSYTLFMDSVFVRVKFNKDLPNNLWYPITGNPEPWNIGNELLGLFGIDEESGVILGVTYANMKSKYETDVFTVDVPNYVFSGPARSYPLLISNPSSELQEGDDIYKLSNLNSVKSDLAWVEGKTGSGIGESFELNFIKSPKYLALINGYISANNPSLYWKNNRIKEFTIQGLTTGIIIKRIILDTPHLQTIDVRELGDENKVKLIISDVYEGSQYSDTCLHFMSYSEYSIRPLSMFKNNK